MKNPSTHIVKDGVSDAGLMRAARDMYEALEAVLRAPTSFHLDKALAKASVALDKARGQA